MAVVQALIGLGSNLDEPRKQLDSAVVELAALAKTKLISVSPYYQSKPMGPADQPDYLNSVALLETALSAQELLQQCQSIENKHGRLRKERWGARTLDLDILVYGEQSVNEPNLVIPHYGIKDRNFVLYPLQAIMGDDFNIPGLGRIEALVKTCPSEGLVKLEDSEQANGY